MTIADLNIGDCGTILGNEVLVIRKDSTHCRVVSAKEAGTCSESRIANFKISTFIGTASDKNYIVFNNNTIVSVVPEEKLQDVLAVSIYTSVVAI